MSASDSNTSPLRLFVLAKKQITQIYDDLLEYVDKIEAFLKEAHDYNENIVENKNMHMVKEYKTKIKGILDIISRNHMKVAFFGRTSNGKSTVINAMLGEKVLPSGIGHTTNCFVQVEGFGPTESTPSDDHPKPFPDIKPKMYVSKAIKNEELEPYIYMEGDPVGARKSINSVGQLANALESEKLSHDALVHVCWPKDKCPLLRDDLILVDSPGIDVSPDVDDWIDKHCQDADVFILVANSESTLMQTEKNFFHKVASKLSAPNIFVLNNRWDASASEPETIKQVLSQHTERVVDFLTRELGVMTAEETRHRIFFISAKEVLLIRLANKKSSSNSQQQQQATKSLSDIRSLDPSVALKFADGFEDRVSAFLEFEKRFEECISRSALRTKFEKHSAQARSLFDRLDAVLESQTEAITRERERLVERNVVKNLELKAISTSLTDLAQAFNNRATALGNQVETMVTRALVSEIERLSSLVDEFHDRSVTFDSSRPDRMAAYKARLNAYLEDGLSRNISAKCLADTFKAVEAFKTDLMTAFAQILPQLKGSDTLKNLEAGASGSGLNSPGEAGQQAPPLPILSSTTASVLETAFHLECRNLCNGFRENLEFHFSLSPDRLIKRLLLPFLYRCEAGGTFSPWTPNDDDIDRAGPRGDYKRHNSLPELGNSCSSGKRDDDVLDHGQSFMGPSSSTMGLRELRLLTSSASVGLGSVLFLSWRIIGPRLVLVCACTYAGLYLYERVTWTSGARERAFKRQFVAYASSELRSISTQAASNCGGRVKQDARATLQHLTHGASARAEALKRALARDQARVLATESLLSGGSNDFRGPVRSDKPNVNSLKSKGSVIACAIDAFARQYFYASSM